MKTNEVAVLENEVTLMGKTFSVYGTVEEPLFKAKDVADWIEHSNPRMMLQSVDEDEKVLNNAYTLGGNQDVWFLTENGVYEVLMLSRKPVAKEFKREVKKMKTNEEISAVYKIVNTVTGDSYIGSSRNVERRWAFHRLPSAWENQPNNKMYQDMQEYGVDKFRFQILAPVMPEYLKQVEQELIEMLKPSYNDRNAYGADVERYKETTKSWRYMHKEALRKASKKYRQTDKYKEREKKRRQTDKYKEYKNKYNGEYFHQLCSYNGETLTLKALLRRFQRMKIPHATREAKKYLINI